MDKRLFANNQQICYTSRVGGVLYNKKRSDIIRINQELIVNYIELQNKFIADYKIIHCPVSKCWSRMHAHIKERKVCKHHIKESYKSLFDLLHEIGHIETDKSGMKRAEQESEATLWAIQQIRKIGLPVKRKVVDSYKVYIKMTYERGVRRGLTKNIKSKLLM